MAGTHATLTQIKHVMALREIGATRAVIAAETGVSISTVSRICKRFGSSKGRARSQLVEEAKQEFLKRLSSDQALLQEATKLLADDLISGRIIREKITEAVLRLQLDDPDQVANGLRALNSAASALATAQKVGRIATGVDKLVDQVAELPILQLHEMTAEDIQAIRDKQRRDLKCHEEELEADEPGMVH